MLALGAGLLVLFAPLAAVLVAAARTGGGRVLAWAFGGSLLGGLVWLAGALVLKQLASTTVAAWWLAGAPWASALGAIWGWRRVRRSGAASETAAKT